MQNLFSGDKKAASGCWWLNRRGEKFFALYNAPIRAKDFSPLQRTNL
jgi:hypothetical protein